MIWTGAKTEEGTGVRRRLYKIHKWLGLITGVPLLLLSLSGSILLFRPELEASFDPGLYRVVPSAHLAPLSEIIQNASVSYTVGYPIAIEWMPRSDGPLKVYFQVGRTNPVVLVNPYTGKTLGAQDSSHPLVAAIYTFHTSFFLSRFGKIVSAILGLTLLVSLLTGFYVYRGALRHIFRLRRRRQIAITIADLHRLVGVWSLLLLTMLAATGFWMNRESLLPEENQSDVRTVMPPLDLERYITSAQASRPELVVSSILIPKEGETAVSVTGGITSNWLSRIYGYFGTEIDLDTVTGKVIRISDPGNVPWGTRLDRLTYPFHTTRFIASGVAGWAIRAIYAAAGLAPACLSISGFLLWKLKQKRTPLLSSGYERLI